MVMGGGKGSAARGCSSDNYLWLLSSVGGVAIGVEDAPSRGRETIDIDRRLLRMRIPLFKGMIGTEVPVLRF